MRKSTILITPISNIRNFKIINEKKIEKRTYDSHMDIFTFYNEKDKEIRRSNLMDVSLYEDLIVENEKQYKILQMLSK